MRAINSTQNNPRRHVWSYTIIIDSAMLIIKPNKEWAHSKHHVADFIFFGSAWANVAMQHHVHHKKHVQEWFLPRNRLHAFMEPEKQILVPKTRSWFILQYQLCIFRRFLGQRLVFKTLKMRVIDSSRKITLVYIFYDTEHITCSASLLQQNHTKLG